MQILSIFLKLQAVKQSGRGFLASNNVQKYVTYATVTKCKVK